MQEKVVIVGGGIGGLAAALALVRRGIDVEVYEQAPELRELGAGVQISANGTRVLHALGLKDALEQVQVLPAGKAIRLWNTGQTWKVFELGMESVERYGFPYITIHRGDLHDVLARTLLQVKPDAIHLNRKCVGLTQTANYVELHFEAGQSVAAKLVIGADGLHSVIRESLFGAAKPQFCDITAWRGVVPIERVPPTIAWDIGTNWIGPGGHAVHYPLRAGTLLNVVGLRERKGWAVEGWNVRGTTEDVLDDFRGWHADLLALFSTIDEPYKWALALRPTMERWSKGRCTLLGDACHSMVPRVRRMMPRNEDVMAICDYAERTIVEAKCNALQPPGNALQGERNALQGECNALQGAVSGECNALQDERVAVRRAQNAARVRKHRAARK
jgi:salicylate hydroxylase